MTWLVSISCVLIIGIAIAAARIQIRKGEAVAHDEYRFHSARTIDHEPIVSELRRGGAI